MQKTRQGKIAEPKVYYRFGVGLDKAQGDLFQMWNSVTSFSFQLPAVLISIAIRNFLLTNVFILKIKMLSHKLI